MNLKNTVYSEFSCMEINKDAKVCGHKIVLPRQLHRQREKGHIKDVFCIKCKKITQHQEIRYNDFLPTFEIKEKNDQGEDNLYEKGNSIS